MNEGMSWAERDEALKPHMKKVEDIRLGLVVERARTMERIEAIDRALHLVEEARESYHNKRAFPTLKLIAQLGQAMRGIR